MHTHGDTQFSNSEGVIGLTGYIVAYKPNPHPNLTLTLAR